MALRHPSVPVGMTVSRTASWSSLCRPDPISVWRSRGWIHGARAIRLRIDQRAGPAIWFGS